MDTLQKDLAKLATSTSPSAMALVRRYLAEIEAAIDVGVSHKAIVEQFANRGHPMTMAAFQRALVAARKAAGKTKRRGRTSSASAKKASPDPTAAPAPSKTIDYLDAKAAASDLDQFFRRRRRNPLLEEALKRTATKK